MTHSIDRRGFLRVALLTSAASVACGRAASSTEALAQPELLVALGPDAVRNIGRRYRQIVPGEQDANELRGAIVASRPFTARIGLTHTSPAAQVRADFAEGRTIVVDGWLLAATEARQCALYSLLPA